MRYVIVAIGFVLVWFVVAVVVGIVVVMVIGPKEPALVGIGIGGSLHNIPGTIIGFLVALHSARTSLRLSKEKAQKKKAKREEEEGY